MKEGEILLCTVCGGHGEIHSKPCEKCGGKGRLAVVFSRIGGDELNISKILEEITSIKKKNRYLSRLLYYARAEISPFDFMQILNISAENPDGI